MPVVTAAVGATGMIVAAAVVHVGKEAAMGIGVVLDRADVAARLLNRILAGHVLAYGEKKDTGVEI